MRRTNLAICNYFMFTSVLSFSKTRPFFKCNDTFCEEIKMGSLHTAKNKSSILSKILLITVVKRGLLNFWVISTQLQLINCLLNLCWVNFNQYWVVPFLLKNESTIYSFTWSKMLLSIFYSILSSPLFCSEMR